MAFNEETKISTTEEREKRAERRRNARKDGLFDSLEGIEEYYLEIEGYTREEAEKFIELECKRRNIELTKKTWVNKRVDDAKVVVNFIKENPEEIKIITPMIITAFTSIASFAVASFSKEKDKIVPQYEQPPIVEPTEPIDRTKVTRLKP